MKRFLAVSITIALMALVVWAGGRRTNSPTESLSPSPDPAPEKKLRELLSSAQRGDVPAYLSAFTGPLRERLEREVEERGRDAFALDLRRASQARKSHAIFAPEPDSPGAVRITVETVYPDRNERQTYRLTEGPDGWRVADVETVRSHTPKAKFGTPAEYQEPEDVPVQGLPAEPTINDATAFSTTLSDSANAPNPIPNH